LFRAYFDETTNQVEVDDIDHIICHYRGTASSKNSNDGPKEWCPRSCAVSSRMTMGPCARSVIRLISWTGAGRPSSVSALPWRRRR
jgi:hypothetical protein